MTYHLNHLFNHSNDLLIVSECLTASIATTRTPKIQGTDFLGTFLVSENGSEFLRKYQISHKRIPLYSPWVGRQWERLIRVVKDCLLKTIGRSSLNYFDFITILSDIADAINSRPLTYTSSTNEILPLTPNDFIKPLSKTAMTLPGAGSNNQFWDSTSAQKELVKSLKYL